MRLANMGGRLVLAAEDVKDGVIDVERASGGRFGPDPQTAYERWDELTRWAADAGAGIGAESHAVVPYEPARLGAPAPRPRQVFAIGLNYRQHAVETESDVPDQPTVFTKFPTAVTGPYAEVALPAGNVDWEVELVAVIGRRASRVSEADAWARVAGLTVGQDLSERRAQKAGPSPQYSLAKSFPGFAPMGPWLVTPDELRDPDDLVLECRVNGERVQRGRTSQMVFPVPALVSRLAAVVTLLPGDVIFTGTPEGVGIGRTPPRFLSPGDELASSIEGIGEMRHRLVAP